MKIKIENYVVSEKKRSLYGAKRKQSYWCSRLFRYARLYIAAGKKGGKGNNIDQDTS